MRRNELTLISQLSEWKYESKRFMTNNEMNICIKCSDKLFSVLRA